ncbi:MAG: Hsp70 family protein [Clostridiales bacterium]|jgi:molecular chaperone DnaK (HSP70)|nr:Hsp70 family protein [Clostridiales bacterium]
MAWRYGIDLGTTHTVMYQVKYISVADSDDKERFSCELVEIEYPHKGNNMKEVKPKIDKYMPSVLYAKEVVGGYEYIVGSPAIDMTKDMADQKFLVNTKRWMAHDAEGDELIPGLAFTAKDAAAEFLKVCISNFEDKHREMVEIKLDKPVVCVTVPVSANPFDRLNTRDAARMAGINPVDQLEEPLAALLSFLYDTVNDGACREEFLLKQQRKGEVIVLVVDIGGGTTDVSIQALRLEGQEQAPEQSDYASGYSIKFCGLKEADKGYTPSFAHDKFGGLEFDTEAATYVMPMLEDNYYEKTGKSLFDTPDTKMLILSKVTEWFESYKRQYKNNKKKGLNEPENLSIYEAVNGTTLECAFTLADYLSWVKPLCDRDSSYGNSIYNIIEETVKESGYSMDEIDYVFLTGGMSIFPPVSEMMQEKFKRYGNVTLTESKHPFEDVARGAALKDMYFHTELPSNKLYATMMLDDPLGLPRIIAQKGDDLPIKDRELKSFMRLSNPVEVEITLLAGRDEFDPLMKEIRRYKINISKPSPSGSDIDVMYSINEHYDIDLQLIVKHPHKDIPLEPVKINHNEGEEEQL